MDSVSQSDRPSEETVVQYKTNPVWIVWVSKGPHVDSVGQSGRPSKGSVGQYKTPCMDSVGQ